MSEPTPAATVPAMAHDHDTVAGKGPRLAIDLDAGAASVATIWLICYLVIGLGWAVSRLPALFDTVKIALAH